MKRPSSLPSAPRQPPPAIHNPGTANKPVARQLTSGPAVHASPKTASTATASAPVSHPAPVVPQARAASAATAPHQPAITKKSSAPAPTIVSPPSVRTFMKSVAPGRFVAVDFSRQGLAGSWIGRAGPWPSRGDHLERRRVDFLWARCADSDCDAFHALDQAWLSTEVPCAGTNYFAISLTEAPAAARILPALPSCDACDEEEDDCDDETELECPTADQKPRDLLRQLENGMASSLTFLYHADSS